MHGDYQQYYRQLPHLKPIRVPKHLKKTNILKANRGSENI